MRHDGIGHMRPVLDPAFVPRTDEVATLRAQLQTLQGRIESLERRIEKMTEREQAVRRAVGQLAHACDVIRK